MTLNEIGIRHYAWVIAMNWANTTTPLEALALVASEVGEAINECRGPAPTPAFALELADIILRVTTIATEHGIDLTKACLVKMEMNRERGNKGRLK